MIEYKELRKIDVTEQIEKKGKFSYLSWAWAVDTLLQHDPKAYWEFKDPLTLPDGSMMVFCKLYAFDKVTHMQLPVLNFNNAAVKNPNSFDLNTAMMRCLAKAISCTGIGLHIYAGEDLPPDDETPEEKKERDEQKAKQAQEEKELAVSKFVTGLIESMENVETIEKLSFLQKEFASRIARLEDYKDEKKRYEEAAVACLDRVMEKR